MRRGHSITKTLEATRKLDDAKGEARASLALVWDASAMNG